MDSKVIISEAKKKKKLKHQKIYSISHPTEYKRKSNVKERKEKSHLIRRLVRIMRLPPSFHHHFPLTFLFLFFPPSHPSYIIFMIPYFCIISSEKIISSSNHNNNNNNHLYRHHHNYCINFFLLIFNANVKNPQHITNGNNRSIKYEKIKTKNK